MVFQSKANLVFELSHKSVTPASQLLSHKPDSGTPKRNTLQLCILKLYPQTPQTPHPKPLDLQVRVV